MKKTIALLLFLPFLLTSCDDEDDVDYKDHHIVGTWDYKENSLKFDVETNDETASQAYRLELEKNSNFPSFAEENESESLLVMKKQSIQFHKKGNFDFVRTYQASNDSTKIHGQYRINMENMWFTTDFPRDEDGEDIFPDDAVNFNFKFVEVGLMELRYKQDFSKNSIEKNKEIFVPLLQANIEDETKRDASIEKINKGEFEFKSLGYNQLFKKR